LRTDFGVSKERLPRAVISRDWGKEEKRVGGKETGMGEWPATEKLDE